MLFHLLTPAQMRRTFQSMVRPLSTVVLAAALVLPSGAALAGGGSQASAPKSKSCQPQPPDVAYAVWARVLAGTVPVAGSTQAATWSSNGNAKPEVIAPRGAAGSAVLDANASQLAGWAQLNGCYRAGYWKASQGKALQWVELHPRDASDSEARGTSGTQQVGSANIGGCTQASLWSGSAGSWRSLHPAAAEASSANAVHNSTQVGFATFSGLPHAALWRGAPSTFIDLHPAGASESVATDVYNTFQVGRVTVGSQTYAALWTGSAASVVNLNPPQASESGANSVMEQTQVGYARVNGAYHASLWTGTAASWVDLHEQLPAGRYSESMANAVYAGGRTVIVVGSALNATSGQWEAVSWNDPKPPRKCSPAKTRDGDERDNDNGRGNSR